MSYQRILCPVDFSEASADAARYAAALARQHKALLTLLHVAPAIDFEFAMTTPNQERLAEFAQHRDQAVKQALDLFPGDPALGYPASREVVHGDAAEQIVRATREGQHDLIVMSTHGKGAIRRWLLLGSVTTKVLHTSECAVIAGMDFADFPSQLRRIVCATDLGPASRRVLQSAGGMARQMGASLTVVHAAAGINGDVRDLADPQWRNAQRERLLEAAQAQAKEAGVQADVQVNGGEPHHVVAAAAKQANADLVVIGRGVHTGVLGRLRAHAYAIIRNSPCPVLSV